MEDTQSEWITQILGGIEEELTQKHISLLVGSLVLKDKYDTTTISSWIRERRVDGLIFARASRREKALIESARKAGLAVSAIAPDENFKGVQVLRSDNFTAGREIAEHLYDLGHRRVAYVGGPKDSHDARQRFEGLEQGFLARKVKIPESNVSFSRYHVEEGVEYAHKWMKMARPRAPTAVVLGNDAMAIGFMRTLQAESVSVPREVSVVGFDDIPAAALYWPGLTTVRQEMRGMGAAACRLLMASVEGEDVPGKPTEFAMKLIVRQSTGPVPGR
jgi:LacI family transcriptional regulator